MADTAPDRAAEAARLDAALAALERGASVDEVAELVGRTVPQEKPPRHATGGEPDRHLLQD